MQLFISCQRITFIAATDVAVLVAIPVKVVRELGVSKFIRPSTTLQQAEECARLPQIDRQALDRVPCRIRCTLTSSALPTVALGARAFRPVLGQRSEAAAAVNDKALSDMRLLQSRNLRGRGSCGNYRSSFVGCLERVDERLEHRTCVWGGRIEQQHRTRNRLPSSVT
jgi:hypothetical protein